VRLLGLESTLLTRMEPSDWSPSQGNGRIAAPKSVEHPAS
jgi:hypothetical protein